jgi:N-acetylmuramoyl-L-alanine amidase
MNKIKIFILLIATSFFLFGQDLSGIKICVDPGHGGQESDDRYIPATGFWESESNLTKAFHVKYILEQHGAEVILTRDGNDGTSDDPSLYQRSQIANNNNVDFFHSIHSNGWQGEHNSTLMLFRGYDDDPVFDEAKEMGNIMADRLYYANRTTGKSNRGDWDFYNWGTQGLGVLRNLTMPGVLSEGSFHDYIPESWRLQNLDYRKKEAWAIAQSFVDYYNKEMFDHKILAGLARDRFDVVDYYAFASLGDKKKPVNNIEVTLNPGGKVYHGDNMNNGFFMFDSLAPGDYELIVEAEGYYSDTAQVTLASQMINFKDFNLISKIPPVVETTTPVEGDTAFPAWDPLSIEFSRSIDTNSVEGNIAFDPATTFSMVWKNNNTKLFIIPDSLEYLQNYTLTLTGEIQDPYGHYLDGNRDTVGGDNFELHFKTTPEDIIPPEIAKAYPELGSNEIELHPLINITYNEEIADSSVTDDNFKLEDFSTDQYVPITLFHFVKNEKSSVCIFPDEELKPDNLYVTRIAEGITDTYNNSTTTKESYSFKTGTKKWNIKKIDNFENGTGNWWQPSGSGSTTGIYTDQSAKTTEQDTTNLITESTKAMKITYAWDPGAESWLLRDYLAGGSPRNVNFNDDYILQAYIFSDGSNNKVRFALDDDINGDAGHEVSPWYTLDWVGWKLIEWNLAEGETGEWIGDGNLDGTLRFDSIQLTYDSENPDAAARGAVIIDDLRLVKEETVEIQSELTTLPDKIKLHQNYPNPFNPETAIEYTLPKANNIRLMIYNIRGNLIRSYQQNVSAGTHKIIWDGKNSQGMDVASGTYIYRLHAGNKVLTRKMVLLR